MLINNLKLQQTHYRFKIIFVGLLLSYGYTIHADTESVLSPFPSIISENNSEIDSHIQENSLAAVIYFSGKVNSKKAADLISWVIKQVNQGVHDFTLQINSTGGDTDAAIAVYQSLKSLPIRLTTINLATVQSAAAIMYCAGQQRYSLPYSFFMLHGNSLTYTNNMSASVIQSFNELNQIYLQSFMRIFKECSHLEDNQLRDYFSVTTTQYFSFDEAKKVGLVNQTQFPPLKKWQYNYNISD